jgi:hypothetical protein
MGSFLNNRAPNFSTNGDGKHLGVAETSLRSITAYTLDGEPVRVLQMEEGPVEGPAPHGMTYWKGQLWYCDADTRAVCTIDIPDPE